MITPVFDFYYKVVIVHFSKSFNSEYYFFILPFVT